MKIKENDGVADIGLKVAVEEKNSAWGHARGASGQPERRKGEEGKDIYRLKHVIKMLCKTVLNILRS